MDKLDITVIILTKDERIHISRAIRNVLPVSRRVVVVDSFSTDGTQEIARSEGAEVVEMPWPGNQAEQFNRALDTLEISTEWILRLDADEWLEDKLVQELYEKLPVLPDNVSAGVIPLGRCFLGRRLKHGIVNGVRIARLFRRGKVRYEHRLMDEHVNILEGETVTFKHHFVDDNLMPLSYFVKKHDGYALREAATMLDEEFGLSRGYGKGDLSLATEAASKRRQKSRYARMPMFWRAAGYFFYRYIVKLGFLDGKEGFLWDFFQGWWYRTLVDAKLFEIKKAAGGDPEKICACLAEHGITFK